MKKLTLGIETSCDETSAAVVCDGREVLSNIVLSQIDLHRIYGGVVPELASRSHVQVIDKVVKEALKEADVTLDKIDIIGVTYGAGLTGALLVGVSYAKALAQALEKPLYAVNHIEGHIAANYLTFPHLEPPFLCLIVSGGHTSIIRVKGYTSFEVLCSTLDDAVGESFDKVARVLDLPYPGGPQLDVLAKKGQNNIKLPSILLKSGDFSYSGLKTAVINYCHNLTQCGQEINKEDIAASFSAAAIDGLVEKCVSLMEETGEKKIAIAGGVAANSYLRKRLSDIKNYQVFIPQLRYCGDNAAMIASQAFYMYKDNIPPAPFDLNADPSLRLRGERVKKQ